MAATGKTASTRKTAGTRKMAGTRSGRQRLLPATMIGIAVLLAVKSAGLVGAAYGAGETGTPTAKTSPPSPNAATPGPATEAALPSPATTQLAEAALPPPRPAAMAAAAPLPEALPGPAERSLLLDLRKRRTELDARAAALEQREMLMGAAEKRLAVRMDELAALQKRLEALEAARLDRDETNWRGLVHVYETMKPKDAAAIFNDLDPAVLVQVVDRMKDSKAAAILAAMMPDRARRLTTDLAALRSRANLLPEPAAAAPETSRTPPPGSPAQSVGSGPSAPGGSAPGAPLSGKSS